MILHRPADSVAPARRHDARLVPAAVAVWLTGLIGLSWTWWWALVGSALTALAGALVVARGKAWWRPGVGWSLVVCAVLLAAPVTLRLHGSAVDPLRAEARGGAAVELRFELSDRPRPVFSAGFGGQQSGVRSVVITGEVLSASVAGRRVDSHGVVTVLAAVDGWADLLPGQEVSAHGTLAPPRAGELTVAVVRTAGRPTDVGPAPPWQRAAQALRTGLRSHARVLGPEEAGLLPALVVGDTDAVPRTVADEFRTAGMSHLLAVSGANLAIMGVAVLLLLRVLRCGPRGSAVGAALAVVAFVVLAGPEPSVLRAAVMGFAGLLALAVGRERSALPALAISVIVLVVLDPAMAVSPGFALSVLATAGLVLLAPRWADGLARHGVPLGVAQALAVPAAAHVVTAPVIAGMAGQVGLVTVLANLLAAPVVAPATVLGVLATVVGPVAPWVAELLVRLAGPEVGWLVTVARHGAALPGAAVPWPRGWWGGVLLAVVTAALLAVLRYRRLRVLAGIALVALALVVIPLRVISPGWPPTGWAVVACDVGQGDALVLATAEKGRAVVVDTGPEPVKVDGCLDRLGVSRVPLVVLSHLHADHVGGLAAVLSGRAVGGVAVGPARSPTWAWDQVRSTTAAAGVPLVELAPGERLDFPGLSLDVLAPAPGTARPRADADGTEINNSSVVLMATTGAGRALLTGDVELSAQAELLGEHVDLSADILKVPHHGSRNTNPEFLDAVHARVALVSVGAGNRYGHPSPITVGELAGHGTLVLRTDTGGDLAVLPGPSVVRRRPRRPPPRAPPPSAARRQRSDRYLSQKAHSHPPSLLIAEGRNNNAP